MSLFASPKKPRLPVAVIDIGGGSISALLLADLSGAGHELIWHTRLPLSFGTHENFREFQRDTYNLLDSAISELTRRHNGPWEAVHCLLSSPWHVADVAHLESENITARPWNEKTITALTGDNLKRHLSHYGGEGYVLVPIDDVILMTELDRRSVSSAIGQKGKNLGLRHFASSTDRAILQGFRERIAPRLSYQEPAFHSGLLALSAIASQFGPNADFILLDIAGELSDILVVRKGALAHVISFPMGKYTIARRLAQQSGRSAMESYSRLKLAGEGLFDEKHKAQLDLELEEIKREWQYQFEESLTGLEDPVENLPVVVSGDDSASYYIGKWAERAGTSHTETPLILDHEAVGDAYPSGRAPVRDMPVLIASLFAQKYL